MPALPLDDAGPYVVGAYLVFVALILIYVTIMATKLSRIERELVELSELVDRRSARAADAAEEDVAEEDDREAARVGGALADERAGAERSPRARAGR
jgi:hypothetical protein